MFHAEAIEFQYYVDIVNRLTQPNEDFTKHYIETYNQNKNHESQRNIDLIILKNAILYGIVNLETIPFVFTKRLDLNKLIGSFSTAISIQSLCAIHQCFNRFDKWISKLLNRKYYYLKNNLQLPFYLNMLLDHQMTNIFVRFRPTAMISEQIHIEVTNHLVRTNSGIKIQGPGSNHYIPVKDTSRRTAMKTLNKALRDIRLKNKIQQWKKESSTIEQVD